MLTHGEDVEAHALKQRGWTISAIARHLGRDRKTAQAYINGTTAPGVRHSSRTDPLEPYVRYIMLRFVDDPHVWASALYDEVKSLGYPLSYPSFVRQIRVAGLRPHCEACRGVKGRDTIEIDHPPGEEIQWDWFERRNAPWGQTAYVLPGSVNTRCMPMTGSSVWTSQKLLSTGLCTRRRVGEKAPARTPLTGENATGNGPVAPDATRDADRLGDRRGELQRRQASRSDPL
jgi:hypothetical protein